MTTLYLSGSITGDIANLKGLTSLTTLKLNDTSVTGDIANLKDLTSLTALELNGTSVTGDIANLNDIVKQLPKRLLSLGYTNVIKSLILMKMHKHLLRRMVLKSQKEIVI